MPGPVVPGLLVPDAARGGVLAVGNFDGVHRGHRAILARLRRAADELCANGPAAAHGTPVPAVAVTFTPHPVAVLRPELAPPPLTTPDRRAELLREAGVDLVVPLPTDTGLLDLTAEAFVTDVLHGRFAARGLVEGENFRFGRGRGGDLDTLRRIGGPLGLSVTVADAMVSDGAAPDERGDDGGGVISSSRIRALIDRGAVARAADLLGRPHRLTGTVTRGDGRGRTLGFPTANLTDPDVLCPGPGIYAAVALIDGRPPARGGLPAAVHVGPIPTFAEAGGSRVEAYLLDFAGDLYGRRLSLDFLERLRGVAAFDGAEALTDQMRQDVERTRAVVAAYSARSSGS